MKINLKHIYLYTLSFIGLLLIVFGAVRIIDLGLKVVVFGGADRYEIYPTLNVKTPEGECAPCEDNYVEKQREIQVIETQRSRSREFASALSFLLVGTPLYLYHWKKIQKEK